MPAPICNVCLAIIPINIDLSLLDPSAADSSHDGSGGGAVCFSYVCRFAAKGRRCCKKDCSICDSRYDAKRQKWRDKIA